MTASNASDSSLTGVSVAYHDQLTGPKALMSKKGRAAARKRRRKSSPTGADPAQNNVNDIGAKIIPQGTGPM
jgi:hypothetical protein